jgi:hypothetical protein
LQKSYVVKSPINFADFGFFVRVGDILVHDTANQNRLTVYRNGEIVKAITQTSLGMAALVKNQFITEVTSAPTTPQSSHTKPTSAVHSPSAAPKKAADALQPPSKRGKAQPKETSVDDTVFRERMGLEDGESLEDPEVRKRLGLESKAAKVSSENV